MLVRQSARESKNIAGIIGPVLKLKFKVEQIFLTFNPKSMEKISASIWQGNFDIFQCPY